MGKAVKGVWVGEYEGFAEGFVLDTCEGGEEGAIENSMVGAAVVGVSVEGEDVLGDTVVGSALEEAVGFEVGMKEGEKVGLVEGSTVGA